MENRMIKWTNQMLNKLTLNRVAKWGVYLLFCLCTAGFAGGPDGLYDHRSLAGSHCALGYSDVPPELLYGPYWIISGVYVSGFGGYASEDWVNFEASPFVSYSANAHGGATYGVATGYRFYSFFALEGGFVRLPIVKGVGQTTLTVANPIALMQVSQWFGYLAGKFYYTLIDHFYLVGGAGVMYRRTGPTPAEFFTNADAYYYAVIAIAGLEWYFTQDWAIFTQYYYAPPFHHDLPPQPTKSFNVPAVNGVVFGLTYKFSI